MTAHLEPTVPMLHDRTPTITVELQFRPPVPGHLRPYFWGAGMLTFSDENGVKVRELDLTDLGPPGSTVRKVDGFGWVLVLSMSHDEAKTALDRLGMPHFIGEEHDRA